MSKNVNFTQLELFEEAKAPIWHVSTTHVWVECPTCKSYNTAQTSIMVGHGKERHSIPYNLERCPDCNQLFDWSDEAIEKACKYSSEYLKLMRKAN